MRRLRELLGPAFASVRLTVAEPGLRRLLLSWLANHAGKGAFLVATFVLAYDAGGATAVGILSLAQFLPQMLLAPFSGLPAARWRPEVVLRGVYALRTVAAIVAAVVVAAGLPIEVLYVVVAIEAALSAFTRPLSMALVPALASSPAQLVGANVGSSAGEGLGTFIGPAIAGLLLVIAGPLAAMIAVVAIYAIGVAMIANLEVQTVGRQSVSARVVTEQLTAGVRTIARHAGLRILYIGIGFQTLVRGLLNVLIVVASVELLGMGDAGVGTLQASIGLGGLIGATAATVLATGGRMRAAFACSLVGWGLPIVVVGLFVDPAVAIGAMVVVGLSNAVLDVSAFTLIQRLSPNASRVAVLGIVDTVANGAIALGGVLAPPLIGAVGIEAALVVTGLILPVVAAASWPVIRRIDEAGVADPHRVALLRGDPLFTPLSLAIIEHLATSLVPRAFEDRALLIREGEPGTEFFLIDEGTAEIVQAGRLVRTLGPGESCGEVALLEDIPRTASVQAVGPVRAFSLGRDAFLEAVTGHATSREVAGRRSRDVHAADEERVRLH
jgi:MFS family permease